MQKNLHLNGQLDNCHLFTQVVGRISERNAQSLGSRCVFCHQASLCLSD